MPLRLRQRAAAALAALLVAGSLAGCTSSSTAAADATPSPVRKTVQPVDTTGIRAEGAQVLDDVASSSLVVVPKRPNGGLVVFLHGWGQTRWSVLSRKEEGPVATALTDAGFTLLAADALGKAWGDPRSVGDYEGLIAETRQRYDLRDVYLMGESMGGLATMQLARRLPEVRAATAWFPVCDLRTMLAPRFQPTIRAAWRGFSRTAVDPVQVGDTPLMVWASDADTIVDARTNAAVCVARAKAAGAEVTYFHTTGEHGDPSNYQPDVVVQFFERHRTPGL